MAAPRLPIETRQSRGLHSQQFQSIIKVATDVSNTKLVSSLSASGADKTRLIAEDSEDVEMTEDGEENST